METEKSEVSIPMASLENVENVGRYSTQHHKSEVESPPTQPPLYLSQPKLQGGATVSFLAYRVSSKPSICLSFLFGLQQTLVMASRLIPGPLIVAKLICADELHLVKVYLICTTFVVCGISTFIQTTFGVRLPMIQGPSAAFLVPVVALAQLDAWKCPSVTVVPTPISNVSGTEENGTSVNSDLVWRERMVVVQGGQVAASIFQIILGCTGALGYLTRYIGPLTITPTVSLIGLSLVDVISSYAGKHWGICLLTIAIFVIFSQYLGRVKVPVPYVQMPTSRCPPQFRMTKSYIFSLFPFLLTIVIVFLLCFLLTITSALSPDSGARTDGPVLDVFHKAPWFRLPYPGQWGAPQMTVAISLGCMCAALVSMVESVGDYYVVAATCQERTPPPHAVNRGIAVEGLGCLVAGLLGNGLNVTSFSDEVGMIGVTRVACRRATQSAAILFCLLGVLPKVVAIYATLPDPIIGAVMTIGLCMVVAVGLSNLERVNLRSSRNLVILGLSMLLGLMIPKWLAEKPDAIMTGSDIADQALSVLLGTSMFIGGFLGFALDNTIPGASRSERGLPPTQVTGGAQGSDEQTVDASECAASDCEPFMEDAVEDVYDLPFCCAQNKHPSRRLTAWARFLPIIPPGR